MRRLMSLAAFALVLAVPVWAQRGGGGHGGGGGHAGFSGGHAGGFGGHVSSGSFGGGHFGGGSRGVSSFHGSPGFSRNPYLHDGFRGTNYRRYSFSTYGFRNPCYGYGCGWGGRRGWGYGYPWWGYGYYPWWWNQDDQSFDDDYYRQYDMANEMNAQSLEQQRMMRQEEADGDQDAYGPRRPDSQARAPQPEGKPIYAPTLLVFRDQHQQEVQNYAIVGQTLWDFAPQHTQKISLADLDLPATEKANENRGITFRVPKGS